MKDGRDLPLEVLNGRPGYINFLDALNSWQLVKELKEATGLPAAASFKHVSPAGAAVGLPLSETLIRRIYFVDEIAELDAPWPAPTPAPEARTACAPTATGSPCPTSATPTTAKLIKPEVSDGVIAPGYTAEALEILKTKTKGQLQHRARSIPTTSPPCRSTRTCSASPSSRARNNFKIDEALLANMVTENKDLPERAKRDLIVALITLKYTQSNSVCYVKDGQAIGVGAGQQSRIHCTRLAGNKADNWYLRQHPKVLGPALPGSTSAAPTGTTPSTCTSPTSTRTCCADGIWQNYFHTIRPEPLTAEEKKAWIAYPDRGVTARARDAFFPFGDNIERRQKVRRSLHRPARRLHPGRSTSSRPANRYGMAMAFTGMRLFHH